MSYDVIVIGAGPGGSAAAKNAAKKGLEVLLVEKRQEIGTPVRCAEGVSKESISELIDVDDRWIAAEVGGAKVISPDETEINMTERMAGNEVGYVLERKIFDRHLTRLASRAGADVVVKTTATGMERRGNEVEVSFTKMGDEFRERAKIVIGADGVESRVGKWAGIDTTLKRDELEVCVQYLMTNIDFDPSYCYFWFGNEVAPGGYAWLFPKGDSTANVGLGILPKLAEKSAKEYLDKLVRNKFGEGEIIEVVAGGVPVKGSIDTAVADNVMLVGDAARHADPITGGGIINAMLGGSFAGDVAAEAVESGNCSRKTLGKYDHLWKNDFGKNLNRNKVLQQKLIDLDDKNLNKLAQSISGYDLEEFSVKKIVTELIRKNPKLLWDLKKLFV
ncbi:MAG: NAD(P)/FAD-dependent oxidoreductase [Archaeoglobaceae archaeon]